MMKRPIYLWGLLFLLLAAVPAMADSISPSSFSATVGVGGTASVHKIVTIDAGTPTTSLVDVFFLSDTTGSMGGAIGAVQGSAAAIMAATAGLGNVAFGVGEYRDIGDAFQYRLDQDITTNQPAVQAGLALWAAGGGGDAAESQLQALYRLANESSWRSGSARILVWMGDYEGHDPAGSLAITEAQATTALQNKGIKVEAVSVGADRLDLTGQATRLAAATGGSVFHGIATGDIVTTITNAITTAFETYSTVALDLSEVPVGVTAASVPLSYSGSFNRSIARNFSFDVSFTGDAPGTYDFNIYATVDGGRVATEADRIVVGAVPEPGSILLFGTFLVGIAGVMRRRFR